MYYIGGCIDIYQCKLGYMLILRIFVLYLEKSKTITLAYAGMALDKVRTLLNSNSHYFNVLKKLKHVCI